MSSVNDLELALERSCRYAELARGFWRPRVAEGVEEYDRLFSHRTIVLCPIYEVEYDSNRAVSQGPTLADTMGFYQAFGLELSVNERPDHLALELEFMSVLAYKEALALQNNLLEQARICRDAQKKFLEAHVGRWVKLFAETLIRESRVEFYTKLAIELKDFIESECALVGACPQIITTLPTNSDAPDARCPLIQSC